MGFQRQGRGSGRREGSNSTTPTGPKCSERCLCLVLHPHALLGIHRWAPGLPGSKMKPLGTNLSMPDPEPFDVSWETGMGAWGWQPALSTSNPPNPASPQAAGVAQTSSPLSLPRLPHGFALSLLYHRSCAFSRISAPRGAFQGRNHGIFWESGRLCVCSMPESICKLNKKLCSLGQLILPSLIQ